MLVCFSANLLRRVKQILNNFWRSTASLAERVKQILKNVFEECLGVIRLGSRNSWLDFGGDADHVPSPN